MYYSYHIGFVNFQSCRYTGKTWSEGVYVLRYCVLAPLRLPVVLMCNNGCHISSIPRSESDLMIVEYNICKYWYYGYSPAS